MPTTAQVFRSIDEKLLPIPLADWNIFNKCYTRNKSGVCWFCFKKKMPITSTSGLPCDFCMISDLLFRAVFFVSKHDGGFLFLAEIASSWFLAVDGALMILRSMSHSILFLLSFQMCVDKEVIWSLSFLSAGGLKEFYPLVGEGPVMMVALRCEVWGY